MLRVLTYNIAFEVSEGVISKGVKVRCKMNECINNIIDFINDNNFDIICFQETSKWGEIMNSTWLKDYNYFNTISEKDNLTIFWNQKLSNPRFMRGSQFSIGRPFQFIYFLSKRICLINLHTGHEIGEYKRLNSLLTESEIELFNNHDNIVIIAGDFNESLPKDLKILNRSFNGVHSLMTCCDSSLGINKNYSEPFDYVLSTNPINKIKVFDEASFLHSDHLPVSAEILI